MIFLFELYIYDQEISKSGIYCTLVTHTNRLFFWFTNVDSTMLHHLKYMSALVYATRTREYDTRNNASAICTLDIAKWSINF